MSEYIDVQIITAKMDNDGAQMCGRLAEVQDLIRLFAGHAKTLEDGHEKFVLMKVVRSMEERRTKIQDDVFARAKKAGALAPIVPAADNEDHAPQ